MNQKEIWLINLDPAIGSEIKKTRPCVILNDDSIGVLPLKLVSPITDHKDKYDVVPWMVKLEPNKINNLNKKSVIDLFQVRSVSVDRFIKKIGEINNNDLKKVKESIKTVFDIE